MFATSNEFTLTKHKMIMHQLIFNMLGVCFNEMQALAGPDCKIARIVPATYLVPIHVGERGVVRSRFM